MNPNRPHFVLYPEQSRFIWKVSWMSLYSSLYAIQRRHYSVAMVPGGVFLTSIYYWRNPDYSSWRRKLDMSYIGASLIYQTIRAYNSENSKMYYFIMIGAVCCYPMSYHFYYKKQYWKSTYFHSMVHVVANIANIVLYSGHILPANKNPLLSYFIV
jgi:hypothetical protein